MNSFNRTLEVFRGRLKDAEANRLKLENRDLDTGKATTRGEYGLADGTYSRLVRKLADRDTAGLDAPLRDNILAFYGTRGIAGALREKDRRKTLEALRKLQAAAVPR